MRRLKASINALLKPIDAIYTLYRKLCKVDKLKCSMAINFAYVAFRLATGIYYSSVWFITVAAYHMVLGGLKAYHLLMIKYGSGEQTGYRCYRNTACMLLMLNIPMSGMVVQMVRTNSGFAYPGYVIYVSAMYAFYALIAAIRDIAQHRSRKISISAASRALKLVSALMSILALQTAMIAQFSPDDHAFRILMNSLTGSGVCISEISIALYMLAHTKRVGRKAEHY